MAGATTKNGEVGKNGRKGVERRRRERDTHTHRQRDKQRHRQRRIVGRE